MNRSLQKFVNLAGLSGAVIAAVFSAYVLFAGQTQTGAGKQSAGMEPVPALTPYVEAHTHFDDKDPEGSVRSALAALGRQNAARIFFLTLPDTYDRPGTFDAEVLLPTAKKYPGKVAVLGGGGSLNPMIMKSVATGDSGPAIQKIQGARRRAYP